jgi:glycosyltransferase involved in cell wall biosynthesis
MTRLFDYNSQAFGGTEYMGRGWHKYLSTYLPKLDNYLCLIIPGLTPMPEELYVHPKEFIVWMHNTPQQFDLDKLEVLRHPEFLKRVKYFIVPSQEHKRLTLLEIPINPEQIYVIPNAIEPLKYNSNKFNKPKKIKLINTSSPDRGIDVLLNAVSLIKEDFELDIFSKFNPQDFPEYKPDPRINFYGFSPKPTVLKHYESAHIHAYPSTYPETFCISQAEAMSAGLLCVTSDLGALPEVSGGKTTIYPYIEDKVKHAQVFAEEVTKAIQKINHGQWDPQEQIKYINDNYSWEAVKQEWIKFHELL